MNDLKRSLGVSKVCVIDFETYYSTLDRYDLKHMSMTEYIRDGRFKVHGFGLKQDDGESVWLKGLLQDEQQCNVAIVAHNIKFDGAILAWKYGFNPALWIDTKAMAKAVLGNKVGSYSLKALAEYYGLEPKGQLEADGILNLSEDDERKLSGYCLHDVELCAEIFKRLSKDFPVGQYKVMDWTIRAFTEPKLVIDLPVLQRTVENEKEKRITAINGSGVSKDDLSSNPKFAKILEQAGVEVPTKKSPRTGNRIPALSLGDEGFIALKTVVPEIYRARVAAKSTIYETRGEKYLRVGKTGALPFDVEFSGAVQTHRFSGGSGAGGNPQNIPKASEFRKAITAPNGYSLIVGDFSQIELRILAYLAQETALIKQLEAGEDIYSAFASKIYGRSITKENKDERFVGKCAVLGLGYGMGAKRFKHQVKVQAGLTISQEDSERIVHLYRTHYQAIPKLWSKLMNMIPLMLDRSTSFRFMSFLRFQHRGIMLPSGLMVQYPNLRWSNKEWTYDVFKRKNTVESTTLYGGKVAENICQALAGEICKGPIERMLDITLGDIKSVGVVHDEILVVVKTAEAVTAKEYLKSIMERSPFWWPQLKLKADVGVGQNWAEAKV